MYWWGQKSKIESVLLLWLVFYLSVQDLREHCNHTVLHMKAMSSFKFWTWSRVIGPMQCTHGLSDLFLNHYWLQGARCSLSFQFHSSCKIHAALIKSALAKIARKIFSRSSFEKLAPTWPIVPGLPFRHYGICWWREGRWWAWEKVNNKTFTFWLFNVKWGLSLSHQTNPEIVYHSSTGGCQFT